MQWRCGCCEHTAPSGGCWRLGGEPLPQVTSPWPCTYVHNTRTSTMRSTDYQHWQNKMPYTTSYREHRSTTNTKHLQLYRHPNYMCRYGCRTLAPPRLAHTRSSQAQQPRRLQWPPPYQSSPLLDQLADAAFPYLLEVVPTTSNACSSANSTSS